MNSTHRVLALLALLAPCAMAHAQFGGIVFDPTQATNVGVQIQQGIQLYTTTEAMAAQAVTTYNQLKYVASMPSVLIQPYRAAFGGWRALNSTVTAYGNTTGWVNAANTGTGANYGYQGASLPAAPQYDGYSALDPEAQRMVAAAGATTALGDSVNIDNLQTLGTMRQQAIQREADLRSLEGAIYSGDPTMHTPEATNQQMTAAAMLNLRTANETNQLLQAQALQQMIESKRQLESQKLAFQAAQGYEQNFNTNVAPLITGFGHAMSY